MTQGIDTRMKICPQCGTENRDVALYCKACSNRLTGEIRCPNCAEINPPDAHFCKNCATPLSSSAPGVPRLTGTLQPTAVLCGRYIILRKLGEGGMGAVYQVADSHLAGKVWALKEMSDAAITDPAEKQHAREAFIQEARLLSTLRHPNLPQVSDFFSERGQQYLVMDFVEGTTLESILDDRIYPFQEEEVLNWAYQICDVLDYLHNQHPPIIFRDLKPGNIMLLPDGKTVKLIDFGIARLFKPGAGKDTITLGTPGYAPPEQYGKGQTDARSDVYALGATLHHLLTLRDPGSDPFNFPNLLSYNGSVSPGVEAAILKAVQQDKNKRFSTILEFKSALLHPTSIPIPDPSPPPMPTPVIGRYQPAPSFSPVSAAVAIPVPSSMAVTNMEAATLGSRFWAYFLDGAMISAVAFFLYVIAFLFSNGSSSAMSDASIVIAILTLLAAIAYYAFMHAITGQTLGKKAAKIKVVRRNGMPLSFGRAFWRAVAYLVIPNLASFLIPVLGSLVSLAMYAWPLFNREHRAVHDFMADTWVIKA